MHGYGAPGNKYIKSQPVHCFNTLRVIQKTTLTTYGRYVCSWGKGPFKYCVQAGSVGKYCVQEGWVCGVHSPNDYVITENLSGVFVMFDYRVGGV